MASTNRARSPGYGVTEIEGIPISSALDSSCVHGYGDAALRLHEAPDGSVHFDCKELLPFPFFNFFLRNPVQNSSEGSDARRWLGGAPVVCFCV